MSTTSSSEDTVSSSSDSSTGPKPIEKKEPLPVEDYVFDQNDEFYMAPPTAGFLHYRTAAIICGILEVAVLIGATLTLIHFYLNIGITGFYSSLCGTIFVFVAIITTTIMVIGIITERPSFISPQMIFLQVEVGVLLIGALISISSMSLGIESTATLFGPFVNVHMMEDSMGPIWPFNLATVCFCGAALGIWFYKIVEGCREFLLDKKFFEAKAKNELEMEIKRQ
uniref:Uncharacterized protein n=1 Tax=Panagrolaimus davidi TaxID=227884 RepID=A0A914Q0Z5_9BILA